MSKAGRKGEKAYSENFERQITWVSKSGYDGSYADICGGSISQVPLALIDSEGFGSRGSYFDNPGSLNESPKELEQSRRDTSAKTTKLAATHECLLFSNTRSTSDKWCGIQYLTVGHARKP